MTSQQFEQQKEADEIYTSFGMFKLNKKNLFVTVGPRWRAEELQLLKHNLPEMNVTDKRLYVPSQGGGFFRC